jgi:hypothetical protein
MLSVVMLSVVMLSVVMLSVIMLNVTYKPFMVSVVMLNFVMLCVVAPFSNNQCKIKGTSDCFYVICVGFRDIRVY